MPSLLGPCGSWVRIKALAHVALPVSQVWRHSDATRHTRPTQQTGRLGSVVRREMLDMEL